jgi:hypothetical protein
MSASKSIKIVDFINNVDDIANKPWRAIRYIKEIFSDNKMLASSEEYANECVEELQKLEAFYSNGGSYEIDAFLKDKTRNVNYPECWKPTQPTPPKEMTLKEVSEALGYEVKIKESE